MAPITKRQKGTVYILGQLKLFSSTFHTASSDTIFIQIYMDAPPGVPGVSKNEIFFVEIKLLSSCAKIDPKRQNLSKLKKTYQKTLFSYTFLNILQFGVNLSAPNLKWRVKWMQGHFLTPMESLGADPYRRYQGFSICL
jgi:hypothetical protein